MNGVFRAWFNRGFSRNELIDLFLGHVPWFHTQSDDAWRRSVIDQPSDGSDGATVLCGVCLKSSLGYSSSPSAAHASLLTSSFQVSNRTTGASMSFFKRSDVKNHLSTRARNGERPVKPVSKPEITRDFGSELHSTMPSVPGSGNRVESSIAPPKPQA